MVFWHWIHEGWVIAHKRKLRLSEEYITVSPPCLSQNIFSESCHHVFGSGHLSTPELCSCSESYYSGENRQKYIINIWNVKW